MAFSLSPSKLLEYLLERVTILSKIFKDTENGGKISPDSLPTSDSVNSDSNETIATSAAVNIVNNRVTINETSINNLSKQISTAETNFTNQINQLNNKVQVATKSRAGLVIPGDGLNVTSNGTISVDFSEMPTDKFEALMKQIRVPIWLGRNTNFYVNIATGSDTLDDGRGETANKPFKTIQACVNYICDNFNLNRYSVNIYVAGGEYGNLVLSDYQSTTGYIRLYAQDTNNRPKIIAKNTHALAISYKNYRIENFDFICNYDSLNIGGNYRWPNSASIKNSSVSEIIYCTFTMNFIGTQSPEKTTFYVFCTDTSAKVTVRGCSFTATKTFPVNFYLLLATNSVIHIGGSNISQEDCDTYLNGDVNIILGTVENGTIQVRGGAIYRARLLGNCTGKKYQCQTGSYIVFGGNHDTMPGSIEGTVDENAYSYIIK